jgi:hypothetical protein
MRNLMGERRRRFDEYDELPDKIEKPREVVTRCAGFSRGAGDTSWHAQFLPKRRIVRFLVDFPTTNMLNLRLRAVRPG